MRFWWGYGDQPEVRVGVCIFCGGVAIVARGLVGYNERPIAIVFSKSQLHTDPALSIAREIPASRVTSTEMYQTPCLSRVQ